MRWKNNRKGYAYYVFLPAEHCIESGWEYASDAQDQVRELSKIGAKVLTKRGLRRIGLVPDRSGDWCGSPKLKVF